MNPRRLHALMIKESLQVIRDPSTVLIAVILPLILLFLMGYAVSLDARRVPLGIVDHDGGGQAKSLISVFVASPYFEVHTGGSLAALMQQMQNGGITGILVIDAQFGANGKLQILADGSDPNMAGFIQNYASGVVTSQLSGHPITVASRFWFNPPVSSRYFLLPGSIAVVMTLIGTLLTALVIAREWERGTMEALMATPATMPEIVIGKLIPYFVLGMGAMLLCSVIAIFWYDVPFLGSPWILIALSALYLFPALSLGLLISTLAKNQFVAAQVSIIAGFLPAFLLSGFLFEIPNMPGWLQVVTHVVPARYFVGTLQTIFLAGDIYTLFWWNALGMATVGTLVFALVLKKSKKGLE